MPLIIVRQDIARMEVDAVVNAANPELRMGGGVCGTVFQAAGPEALRAACEPLAPIRHGDAVITPGFGLKAKWIVHALGPVYNSGNQKESERLLRGAYLKALQLAQGKGCESIAFPLLSSGAYGYPKQEALRVGSEAIEAFLSDNEMDVYLAVFDKQAFDLSRKLVAEVRSYIDEQYVLSHPGIRSRQMERELSESLPKPVKSRKRRLPSLFNAASESMPAPKSMLAPDSMPAPAMDFGIEALVGKLDEPFSVTLLKLIDQKGCTDVQVYKRANLSRKLFSKINTVKGYMPSKRTAIALAIGLRLSLPEAEDLLKRAGYALSPSEPFDMVIKYYIERRQYNVMEINAMLYELDLPLLGTG